jgi:lysyl-tRNA synthetase class 2
MSALDDIRSDRKQKIAELRKQGVDPYPARITLQGTRIAIGEARGKQGKLVLVAGRLWSLREHGAIAFVDLRDTSGQIQLLLRRDALNNATLIECMDTGDFVAAAGTVMKTKSGELSVEVAELQILTKSLRPLPAEQFGLKDVEERLRKRYLDVLLNPELKALFETKAKFWNATREFLLKNGFLEVETPVLETTAGGADARPFQTHHNALDMDVYLRISMGELWQKRLMVAGFEKTFEIGRQFRNEGIDPEHLQDYTQMEFYWAYADYRDGMNLVEQLYKHVAQETFGTLQFTIGAFTVDLNKPWETYDYAETIQRMTGVDIATATQKSLEAKIRELKIEYDTRGFNLGRAMDTLWKYCRKQIAGPGFLVNAPVTVSPLAKRVADNPQATQRFQVIIAGSELGNGYSELNDPQDQAERFEEQQRLRAAGDAEAQMYDRDFVEALEYGMPPTCGFGMSERLFAFLANKPAREIQLFPLMRPKGS